jgi:hypothetical protein
LIDNGKSVEITEKKAHELIREFYTDGQHKTFPQWDGSNVSLGHNQCVKFTETLPHGNGRCRMCDRFALENSDYCMWHR